MRNRRSTPRPRHTTAATVLWSLLLGGICGGSAATSDPLARQRIAEAQAAVTALERRGDADSAELAAAHGALALAFHTFAEPRAALDAARRAAELDPADPRWVGAAGRLELELGETERAVSSLERATALAPGESATWVRLGDALLQLDRHDEAEAAYRKALAIEASSAAALVGLGKAKLGRANLGLEQPREAIALFERALGLQPGATSIHYHLAQAYRRLGDLDQARTHLALVGEEPVTLDDPWTAAQIPLRSTSPADRLRVEIELGADPRQLFERAARGIDFQAEDSAALLAALDGGALPPATAARFAHVLAAGALRQEDEPGATALLQRALALDPTLLDAHVRLGNALARSGDLDSAAMAYRKALTLAPEDSEALAKLAAIALYKEDYANAQQLLETLLGASPSHVEGMFLLAETLERRGDHAGATALYTRLLELELRKRERIDVHRRLARLASRAQHNERALDHWRQALEVDPAHVPAITEAAGFLASLGRFAGALMLYDRWIELEPDNPAPRSLRGGALILSGQHAEARDTLEEALVRFPNDERVIDLLSRHLVASTEPTVRNPSRALALARRAFEAAPTQQRVETLAMALAATGDFRSAANLLTQLIEQIERSGARGAGGHLDRLRRDLERYEAGGG